MCKLVVATTIMEVLDEIVKNQGVFTAYDITVAARSKAPNELVRHSEVRDIVNNEFITQQMAGYDREICTLDISGSPQARVYFPDTKTASDHPLVSDDSVATDDDDDDDGDDSDGAVVDLADDELKTTKEGRLQIPRKLLSQISISSGSYDILINGSLKCATPDARGDVRICLKQFGITDSKVKITVDNDNNNFKIESV